MDLNLDSHEFTHPHFYCPNYKQPEWSKSPKPKKMRHNRLEEMIFKHQLARIENRRWYKRWVIDRIKMFDKN